MDDEVIRDPLREKTTYWGGIWMAIGFAVGAVVTWWLGGLVGGVASVVIRIVAVLRVPTEESEDPDWFDPLFDAFDDETAGIECDSGSSGSGGLGTFTVTGPNRDAVLARLRAVAKSLPLPDDAYIWIPEPADDGTGRRYAL